MIKYSGLINFSAISLLLLIFKKLSIHTVPDKQKVIHYLIEKYRQCFYLRRTAIRQLL